MSEQHKITLLMSEFVTHDVKRFVFSKPPGFTFEPGQGVELTINQPDWRDESRPFTPTNFVDDKVLEFTIKRYVDHDGVTKKLHGLPAGSELLISEPFGTINYQGPGVFLAGGAGITPFIAILRAQYRSSADGGKNHLIFSNKTPADIIYEKELRHYLGKDCILTCTDETVAGYESRLIDKDFLGEKISDFSVPFYVCGPPGFMDALTGALKELGADPQNLVFEQ
ncbi:MAG: flavodoxin reductase [Gammaproteobacteria bacterium]|nr:flavodoxin reductase [Gammaproteobacteria bacterium]MBU1725180.1 flavodoxin reductase [Gammaproteobacteria bacterium]MBU2005126.1 flavodoxin reductase [Gammaproteobacteria bacterium]